MDSIWTKTASLPAFPALTQDTATEVLVIGGGLTGLLCAHRLREAGLRCLVVEANTIMSGVSGHTTAKLTSQHGLIYTKLEQTFGREAAALYYGANQAALAEFRRLCAGIPCDLEAKDAFLFSRTDTAALEQECALVRSLGGRAEFRGAPDLPFPVAGALCFPDQAQFHPLKLAAALAEKLDIREHTQVLDLQGTTAITEAGRIRAEHVIVATHFPFLRFRGGYFLKLYQQRSYVLALEGAPALQGMYLDTAENGLSLRTWGDLLLLGGGGHRTGQAGGGWAFLREAAKAYFPEAREVLHWATQDCMPLDSVPYIGPYGQNRGCYVATGFQKWGMTTSMVAAMVLTDLIVRKSSPWASLFAPSRSMLRPQLGRNALEAVKHLLTPTAPRCPHMGCALKWNPLEHTWDCPCHGSRFQQDGVLLKNPAEHGLRRS